MDKQTLLRHNESHHGVHLELLAVEIRRQQSATMDEVDKVVHAAVQSSADRQEASRQTDKRQLRDQMEITEERIRLVDERELLHHAENNVRHQEMIWCGGVLVWKITNFERKRNDAIAGIQPYLHSSCFHTKPGGYKMCARIHLNGDGMGKGTHISVFFVVMRGEYDALLSWPFRQRVTIMLLDQDKVESVVDSFTPDPDSPSFQKPQSEKNIAWGCPLFFPVRELHNHAYVRDDTIFLKFIVDTSHL